MELNRMTRNNTLRAHRAVYGQNALRTRTVQPEKGKGRKDRPRQKGPTGEHLEAGPGPKPSRHTEVGQVAAAAHGRDERPAGGEAGALEGDEGMALDFYVCQTCRALIPDPSRPWIGHYDECEVRARHVEKAGKRVLETHAELFEKLAGIEDD